MAASKPEILPAIINRPDLRKFARILDSAFVIPGTKISIGLDPLLGLIPGIGDALGALLGSYIVLEAAKEGVSNFVLARMLLNIAIDTFLGSIPIFGDIFDVLWQSNIMNIELLERSNPVHAPGAGNRTRLFWVTVALAVAVLIIMALTIGLLLRLLISLLR